MLGERMGSIAIKVLEVEGWRAWRELRLEALAEAPNAFGSTLAEWQGAGDTEQRWRARLQERCLEYHRGVGRLASGERKVDEGRPPETVMVHKLVRSS